MTLLLVAGSLIGNVLVYLIVGQHGRLGLDDLHDNWQVRYPQAEMYPQLV